ncbi:FAD-dependent oxidoreductase [Amycolatopsis antarctica]|uniref:FAD-dependent oxidoreductase n=1 Tax=Amycolatopsis antarctica TaxID=1854586 RepID=A0A263D2H5_9PSEU|nr:FAD-dependent oxidoreductase [Amycolatopsis antarctica]OZM72278.1 FAD-dependent oxidoreductase [Amycolatopsis antarctica]
MKSVAIVGGSLAGSRAAQELRAQGYDGLLLMIGEERHRPYDRPPLSKDFLAGTTGRDELDLLDAGEDTELDLHQRTGVRAERLDPAAGTLTLSDGAELAVDGVVIATGGRARRLPGTAGITGVHVLRTLDDAVGLRAELTAGSPRVVVVGAGFIGAEVASTCRRLGLEVTVLEALGTPLAPVLGADLGGICAGLHADHGTELRCGTAVDRLSIAEDGGSPRVTGVHLADGGWLPADVVVVGIGMTPETGWLADSGLILDDGVRTDHGLVTAFPNVVAIGDVARYDGPERPVRHEHWTNASDQAGVAVANLLAGHTVRRYVPSGYVWSDQYSCTIQLAGHPLPTDELTIVDGDVDERRFVATYLREGATVAVAAMNNAKLFNRMRRQLRRDAEPAGNAAVTA